MSKKLIVFCLYFDFLFLVFSKLVADRTAGILCSQGMDTILMDPPICKLLINEQIKYSIMGSPAFKK